LWAGFWQPEYWYSSTKLPEKMGNRTGKKSIFRNFEILVSKSDCHITGVQQITRTAKKM
jgi:hypothetical protein